MVSRIKVLCTSVAIVTVVACGGGGEGVAPLVEPTPYEVVKNTIPLQGGAVLTKGSEVKIDALPQSLTGPVPVEINLYRNEDNPVPALGRTDSVLVGLTIESVNVKPTGFLMVTLPFTGTFNESRDFVSLRSKNGVITKDVTYHAADKAVKFWVSGKELAYLKSALPTTKHHAVWVSMPWPNFQPFGNSAKLYEWLPGATVNDITSEESGSDSVKKQRWSQDAIDPEKRAWLNTGRCAIVLHGMMNSKVNMNSLAFFLSDLKTETGAKVYHTVLAFDYDWTDNIKDNGTRLSKMVEAIKSRAPTVKVDLYGHSMGGLVSRYAIQKGQLRASGPDEGLGSKVDRLFTFGTPHTGVPFPMRNLAVVLIASGNPATVSLGQILMAANGVRDLERGRGFQKAVNDKNASSNGKPAAVITFVGIATSYKIIGKEIYPWVRDFSALLSPSDVPLDGIVSRASAEGHSLSSYFESQVRVPDILLNHSDIRGVYGQGGLNIQESQVFSRQLRSYVLGLGQGSVTID